MKRVLSLLVFSLFTMLAAAQTTYYWIGGDGGNGTVSFTTNSKWNTALDGSGQVRTTEDSTDILIIDGTNIGGTTPTLGNVVVKASSTAMQKLILQNNANLTLLRITSGTGTLKITGDATAAPDLLINTGCTLVSTMLSNIIDSAGNTIALSPNATGQVSGVVSLLNGASKLTVSNSQSGGALFFENGSVCNVKSNITFSSSGSSSTNYPFGSNSGVIRGVVFNNGSKLVYLGGNAVFTSTSIYYPVEFKKGSTFRIETSVPAANVTSSNLFRSRRFSNVEIASGQSVIADAFYSMDNLTIENGATFYLKSSGASPISGNIINNGTFGSVPGFTSSNLLMVGTQPQTVGGSGTFSPFGAFSVATKSDVTVNTDIVVNGSTNSLLNGKINLQNHTITGSATFQSKAALTITSAVVYSSNDTIRLDTTVYNSSVNIAGVYNGIVVSGIGVPQNTFIIGTSSANSLIILSNPVTGPSDSVTLSGGIPVIRTSNANGIDGSLGGIGTLSLSSSTDYIFDGPTTNPFSLVSTSSMRNVTFNAPATTNKSQYIDSSLILNSGVLTIRPNDTLRIRNGNNIQGSPFSSGKYIVTQSDASGIGALRIDLITESKLFPIGSATHYLPVTVTPTDTSNVVASVFEGITADATFNGAPLTGNALQSAVNAVWKMGRVVGLSDVNLSFNWDSNIEGGIFTAADNSSIGVITNSGTAWSLPSGTADNVANTASATVTTLDAYSIGSSSNISPFIFNDIPNKTYGDADFTVTAISQNTTQPISYVSSNTSVATISNEGLIHIVGAGTTDITASQATDGTYPDATLTKVLTVAKAPLVITAVNASRLENTPNPDFSATYSGFVNGEDQSVLTTPVALITNAVLSSAPGQYDIVPSGAVASNYEISYINGVLTINASTPLIFVLNPIPDMVYGATSITATATSGNTTNPIVFSSSNTSVATIAANGSITIVGVGTTEITASQLGDGTYPDTSLTQAVNVAKAPLTITVADTSKLFGTDNPAFRFVYSGFVYGENESVLTALPTATTAATINSLAGIYDVTPSGALANNYTISNNAGTLTINPVVADSSQTSLILFTSNGVLSAKLLSAEVDLGDIVLYNINGQEIARKNILAIKGTTTVQFNINALQSSVYIVSFKGKRNKISKMIAVIK